MFSIPWGRHLFGLKPKRWKISFQQGSNSYWHYYVYVWTGEKYSFVSLHPTQKEAEGVIEYFKDSLTAAEIQYQSKKEERRFGTRFYD